MNYNWLAIDLITALISVGVISFLVQIGWVTYAPLMHVFLLSWIVCACLRVYQEKP